MSHPIRYQQAGPVRFYRMGSTIIAKKGNFTFVVSQYSCGGGWEATKRSRDGLKMPILGDVFPTMRAAAAWLLPMYETA